MKTERLFLEEDNGLAHDTINYQCLLEENFILATAKRIAYAKSNIKLFFNKIVSDADWIKVGQFRLSNYRLKKTYMMAELDEKGLDPYDKNGNTYAAWLDDNIVASIRLCTYPFETCRFIESEYLKQFLGPQYQNEYLEWTRLLIRPKLTIPYLLPALIVYAGMQTLRTSSYHKYFGYSTPPVRRLFSRFYLANESFEFSIPHRGEHKYFLLKGDFAQDFINLLKNNFQL